MVALPSCRHRVRQGAKDWVEQHYGIAEETVWTMQWAQAKDGMEDPKRLSGHLVLARSTHLDTRSVR